MFPSNENKDGPKPLKAESAAITMAKQAAHSSFQKENKPANEKMNVLQS